MPRPEHLTGSILTGHFVCEPTYRVQRPAGSDDWLLFCTLAGSGRIAHRFGELMVEAGDLTLIAPRTAHDYGDPGRGGWEFLWAHFHPRAHWLDWLRWPTVGPGVAQVRLPAGPLRSAVSQRLLDCHHSALTTSPRGLALAQAALEDALIRCDEANPQAADANVDPRARAAMEYCLRNLAARVTLGDVAAHCGLSVFRLAHLFRAETGTTVQRFIEQQRMLRAGELLIRTALPVQDVAVEVGYPSAFYFATRFRKATGSSPSAYRERMTPASRNRR